MSGINSSNRTVYWVVINYFNEEETIHFVESAIRKQSEVNTFVCIVNNGSRKPALIQEIITLKNCIFLDPGTNTGYAGALVFALKYLTSRIKSDDLIIFSNTDMEISDRDFLKNILKKYADVNFGMLGPSIISLRSGLDQNPFADRNISGMKIKFLIFVFTFYPVYLLYQFLSILKMRSRRLFAKRVEKARARKTYSIHGSFMVISSKFGIDIIEEEGSLPFFFGEELYFAELCKLRNYDVIYDPQFMVKHFEHSVTGLFKSVKHCRQLRNSLKQFYRDFYAG